MFLLNVNGRHDKDVIFRGVGGIGMETAFVLIKALPMKEKDVYASLLRMDAVVETHSVYGEYDLVARLDFNDSKEMTRFLIEQMRTIPGVVKTETLISAEV
tara:strand:+ start:375 stop:677 length:303 start_codon:yes stop_codon:yes gene_type:complete